MSASSFDHHGIRIAGPRDLGAKDVEPTASVTDKALGLMSGSCRTHRCSCSSIRRQSFPWECLGFRPDLMPFGRKTGNEPVSMTICAGAMSVGTTPPSSRAEKRFPSQPFLIVRFRDHQPEFSPSRVSFSDPAAMSGVGRARQLRSALLPTDDAIDRSISSRSRALAVMPTSTTYLPLVIPEAAGIPLDPPVEEQTKIMLRCGPVLACKDGAEARRFNRLDRRRLVRRD